MLYQLHLAETPMKARHLLVGLAATMSVTAGPLRAASTTVYTYDALGRLVKSSTTGTINDGVQMDATYDDADNRAAYKITGATTKAVIVPINGLTVIPIKD